MKPGQVARWKTRRWAGAESLCRKYGHSRLRPYIGQSILAGIILPMTDSVPAHRIAPLTKRFVAFFFDYALIAAYLVVLLVVGFGLTVLTDPLPIPSPWVTELIAFSTTVLPVILYFALQEGGARPHPPICRMNEMTVDRPAQPNQPRHN
ncbi:MAG: hypothetical protein R6X32_04295 [Chloroflexota bacterium]